MAPPGLLEYIVKGLSKYREQALSGKLEPSEGVVTLGVLRAVGDWNEPFGSELVKAAKDLEAYYLDHMK